MGEVPEEVKSVNFFFICVSFLNSSLEVHPSGEFFYCPKKILKKLKYMLDYMGNIVYTIIKLKVSTTRKEHNIMSEKLWYAIQTSEEDSDWGTGSHDLEEAKRMAADMDAYRIAVIDGAECVDEIYDFN